MKGLDENISPSIVKSNTGDILKKLAPELEQPISKMIEITPDIINGLIQCKCIDQIAVMKVAEAVAPQLPMLGEKLYESLTLCSEEERAKIIKMIIISADLAVLCICGAGVIKFIKIHNAKTRRVEIVCDLLKSYSPIEIIKIIGNVFGKNK